MLVLFLPIQNLGNWQLIIPGVFMIIGFIILPKIIIGKIIGFKSYIYQSIFIVS
ncbi:hypothetical protein [Staphylococcus schleiferi]|uniref:hypothetical protein n=1 Tax=Staphylococcus schleiferi TaxID=1295 RepID=UPI00247FAD1B|nr:hypothetical protein [Staphylococcus schleiferi]